MEEHRRFVRLDTRLEFNYTVLPSGDAHRTVSRDVSGGGVCLFAERALAPGTCLQVAMKLPEHESPANFTAEVVWSESYEMIGKTERQQATQIGVRFMEIAPKDLEAVMQHGILRLQPPAPRS